MTVWQKCSDMAGGHYANKFVRKNLTVTPAKIGMYINKWMLMVIADIVTSITAHVYSVKKTMRARTYRHVLYINKRMHTVIADIATSITAHVLSPPYHMTAMPTRDDKRTTAKVRKR